MFHSLKRKTVGHSAGKHEPGNTEFDNLKQGLDNVSKALTAALADIDTAEKSWKTLAKSAAHFSSGLHSLYPKEDDLRALFKTTLDEVEAPLQKEMDSVTEPTSKVKSIERIVRAYLTEIKTLAAEYNKVSNARKDYAMYNAKVDKLGKKTEQSDKQSRNLDKLEDSKAKYDSILGGTVHRMKSTYEKAPTMFRAAYVAYWLYHSQMSSSVTKHFKPSYTYSNAHAEGLFKLSESSAHVPPAAGSSDKA